MVCASFLQVLSSTRKYSRFSANPITHCIYSRGYECMELYLHSHILLHVVTLNQEQSRINKYASNTHVCRLLIKSSSCVQDDGLITNRHIKKFRIWCDFDRASSLICGNKMPTRCNRGFYCRSYCLFNTFRAPLCPSSGAKEYYTVVAACGISCCGFQVAGLVWRWGLCVRFAGCCSILQTDHITRPATWKPQHEIPQAATTV